MTETISFSINQLSSVLLQAFLAFVAAMALTPVYTHFAFKHKWWKQARTHSSTSGEATPIVHSLQAAKHARDFPTMAGIIAIAAVVLVTVTLNFSRNQTWLPLFAFVSAGVVGLIDDYINIRGSKNLAGGLRSRLKFMLIFGIAAAGALYFYYKLGYTENKHKLKPRTQAAGQILGAANINIVIDQTNDASTYKGKQGQPGLVATKVQRNGHQHNRCDSNDPSHRWKISGMFSRLQTMHDWRCLTACRRMRAGLFPPLMLKCKVCINRRKRHSGYKSQEGLQKNTR
jgi:hypothetical protein